MESLNVMRKQIWTATDDLGWTGYGRLKQGHVVPYGVELSYVDRFRYGGVHASRQACGGRDR